MRPGRRLLLPALLLAVIACRPAQPPLAELKREAAAEVESRRVFTQHIVDSIFSFSELGFQEFETAAYVTGLLEKEGFQVTRGVAGMPTAFVGSYGSGAPVMMSSVSEGPGASVPLSMMMQERTISGCSRVRRATT